MIITKTPFRVSLFGGGTDYRPWFEKRPSLVVVTAMQKYCYISVRGLPPFFDNKYRIVYSKIERVGSRAEIQHPSIRACLEYLGIEDGLEIHHDGDLPARSGIGSSSTFTVGMLHALHAYRHRMPLKKELSDQAIHVEQSMLKESVGIQDQIAAAYGGIAVVQMGPGFQYAASPLVLPPDYQGAFESHVLLGFTGVSRTSSGYASAQMKNIEDAVSTTYLEEMSAHADMGLSLLRNNSDFRDLGQLIYKSLQEKKKLHSTVSTDAIDQTIDGAIKNGAYGARLMGAGGGGFLLIVAPPHKHAALKEALKDSIKAWVPYSIDHTGSQVIFHSGD